MMTILCTNYLNVIKRKHEKTGVTFESEGVIAFPSSVRESRNTLGSFGDGFLRVHQEMEKKCRKLSAHLSIYGQRISLSFLRQD